MPSTSPSDLKPQTAIVCDWTDWSDYLSHVEASDAEKRAMIEAVFAIVVALVDLKWEVRAEKTCGQNLDLEAALTAAVVNSEATQKQEGSPPPHHPQTGLRRPHRILPI